MPAISPPPKSRVFIVDRYGLIRRGLRDLIGGEEDMEICGEAKDEKEAFNAIVATTPDLVTTEISLSGDCGLELIKRIRALERNIGILVVSMCDEFVYAERALRAGAHGFVNKQENVGGIPGAIRSILTGNFAFTAAAKQRMCEHLVRRQQKHDSPLRSLSDRELEIGSLIGSGASTREIATRLGVSIKTIETHRAHIKLKLGLPNAIRLMQYWFSWAANGENEPRQLELPVANGHGLHVDGEVLPVTMAIAAPNGHGHDPSVGGLAPLHVPNGVAAAHSAHTPPPVRRSSRKASVVHVAQR